MGVATAAVRTLDSYVLLTLAMTHQDFGTHVVSHSHENAHPWIFQMKSILQHALESLLLHIPALSEARLGSSRVLSFLRAWHYLHRSGVRGDYLEFGVWRGQSFVLSLRCAKKFFRRGSVDAPRFFACDSFAGLPSPDQSRDALVYHAGQYQADQQTFLKHIRRAARGWDIRIISGFYESSLTSDVLKNHVLAKAAFVTIDCDLYSSTKTALQFITPILQTGTVLYFDDWFFTGGDLRRGEALACAEWLRENPVISLVDFGNVGIMGKMFLVNTLPSPSHSSPAFLGAQQEEGACH